MHAPTYAARHMIVILCFLRLIIYALSMDGGANHISDMGYYRLCRFSTPQVRQPMRITLYRKII